MLKGMKANVRPTMSDRTSVGFRRRSPVRYDMPLTFWKLAKTRPKARWGNGDSHATASIRRTACTSSRLPTDQGKLSRGRSLLCPPCCDLAPLTYPPEGHRLTRPREASTRIMAKMRASARERCASTPLAFAPAPLESLRYYDGLLRPEFQILVPQI